MDILLWKNLIFQVSKNKKYNFLFKNIIYSCLVLILKLDILNLKYIFNNSSLKFVIFVDKNNNSGWFGTVQSRKKLTFFPEDKKKVGKKKISYKEKYEKIFSWGELFFLIFSFFFPFLQGKRVKFFLFLIVR